MKRYPSVDKIESIGGIDREDAIRIRRLLDGRDDPESYEAGQKLVRACFHQPGRIQLVMHVVNDLLGTHGVEYIRANGDAVADYCNTGDGYNWTVLYDIERGVFYVTSWADWIETAENNGRYKFQ
jgi:hypothetical protein